MMLPSKHAPNRPRAHYGVVVDPRDRRRDIWPQDKLFLYKSAPFPKHFRAVYIGRAKPGPTNPTEHLRWSCSPARSLKPIATSCGAR